MKKRIFALFLITVLSAGVMMQTAALTVYASNVFDKDLRVGLTSRFNNLGSITFSSGSIIAGFERANGFFVECRLSSRSGFVATVDLSYYVAVGSFSSFADARSHVTTIKNRGYHAAPCVTGTDRWTVYVGGFTTERAANDAIDVLGGRLAAPNGRRIVLMENNENVVVFDSPDHFPQFKAESGNITLGDQSYRGRIELMRINGQNLTAINVISVEEYLYSVVPSEMPPTWHAEALKAQAVASRTYTATRTGAHGNIGFDICDTDHCQTYKGANEETTATTAAVDDTRHLMIWYDRELIQATYFSSSGGFTDHSENVWNSAEPYLRSVEEIEEWSPRKWTRVITLTDLDRALNAADADIGRATGMYINRVRNNRVQELVITGTRGTRTLTKEDIRTFFTPISGGRLESRNFTIEISGQSAPMETSHVVVQGVSSISAPQSIGSFHILEYSGTAKPAAAVGEVFAVQAAKEQVFYSITEQEPIPEGAYVLSGAGLGHGVGMSQAGAQGMALQGYTFRQILQHYYTDVDIHR
ncbi:MAG: SpoIID/LytB domain-containing protein [Defluviitaleaceae bacterium]|nr:SpoIID/LytB domain-containing protein [Defluviitaleaceae bacterium]MCL2837322.1 SpoIID/LytB domain-containing protein [Defluviitaleaceae bacterium]